MTSCPMCRAAYKDTCGTRIFIDARCPICWESGEDFLLLPCRHGMCVGCFEETKCVKGLSANEPRPDDPDMTETERCYVVLVPYDAIEWVNGLEEGGYLKLFPGEYVWLEYDEFVTGDDHNQYPRYGFFRDCRGRVGWSPQMCVAEV